MCGIFAYLSRGNLNPQNVAPYREMADKCSHRGPDQSQSFICDNKQVYLVFHRLKIVDTSSLGMQPFHYKGWSSISNAEIYNHEKLRDQFDLQLNSKCDTEVIIPILQDQGPFQACQHFDGVFAFVVVSDQGDVYIARDPIGVRSLFIGQNSEGEVIVASEMKCIPQDYTIQPVSPGTISVYSWSTETTRWSCRHQHRYYHYHFPDQIKTSPDQITLQIRRLLETAVDKRTMSDRPVGCLLSGGLDSSIIASLLSNYYQKRGGNLRTFSIGLAGSVDLLYAQQVADYLKTDHTEIVVTEAELLAAIPRTIYHIESYDTTTVRASTPMLLLSEYISKNTDIVVIYSGEGSDEASGSYIYFHNAPSPASFKQETERLLQDLHYFDVLRCDKSSAAAGLEIRVPFLDQAFLKYYMSLDPSLKQPIDGMEKYFLRKAFSDILPDSVTWRKKEGMSDGVSSMEKPWYQIIQDQAASLYSPNQLKEFQELPNPPKTLEQYHYRKIFEQYYPSRGGFLPYFWMPKWSGDVSDPSARILQVYTELE